MSPMANPFVPPRATSRAACVDRSPVAVALSGAFFLAAIACGAPPAGPTAPEREPTKESTKESTSKSTKESAPPPPPPAVPPTAPSPASPASPEAPAPGPDEIPHCEPQSGLPRQKIEFFGEEWDCELCLDADSRAVGMGARRSFPAGTAMVFVHPNPQVLSYWMKDCLIDLDIVFVDADGRIAAIHEAKREPLRRKSQSQAAYDRGLKRYSSNRRVQFALEFPAGTVARLKPTMGQRIAFDRAGLVKRAD